MLILTCECGVRRFVDCRSGHRPMLHRGRRTGKNVNLMRSRLTLQPAKSERLERSVPDLRPVQIADTRARPNRRYISNPKRTEPSHAKT